MLHTSFTDFDGKTVVVTGATGEIGRGIALAFAACGAHVIVHYRSRESSAKQLVGEIECAGGSAATGSGELENKESAQALLAGAAKHSGAVDVLINNAGIYPVSRLVDTEEEEWDAVINANLRSTFLCTQAATAVMPAGGAIVNIASIEADFVAPMHSHYSAAKSAVVMFTRSSARELAEQGIRCNVVLPGLIWREGIEQQWPEGVARWKASAPLERLGAAQDVANACLYLSSPASAWITGAELRVDGGMSTASLY